MAFWEALASDVPKGLTLGSTQKDSVEGTVSEQSGPTTQHQKGMSAQRLELEVNNNVHALGRNAEALSEMDAHFCS